MARESVSNGFGIKLVAFMAGIGLFLGTAGVSVIAYRMGQKDAYTDLADTKCKLGRQYQIFATLARTFGDQTAVLSEAVSEMQKSVETLDAAVVTVRPLRKKLTPVKGIQSPALPSTINEATSDVCHP